MTVSDLISGHGRHQREPGWHRWAVPLARTALPVAAAVITLAFAWAAGHAWNTAATVAAAGYGLSALTTATALTVAAIRHNPPEER